MQEAQAGIKSLAVAHLAQVLTPSHVQGAPGRVPGGLRHTSYKSKQSKHRIPRLLTFCEMLNIVRRMWVFVKKNCLDAFMWRMWFWGKKKKKVFHAAFHDIKVALDCIPMGWCEAAHIKLHEERCFYIRPSLLQKRYNPPLLSKIHHWRRDLWLRALCSFKQP